MVYLVTGIGTDVGKTVVASIISKALNATYWKPVQAGDLSNSDSIKVQSLTGCQVIPEKFKLSAPMSPHAAADIDDISIRVDDFEIPVTNGDLVIEGAGGIMVPLNNEGETFLDLFMKFDQPVIIVSRNYLGSINHTLMTVECIKQKGLTIEGIIFVGEENSSTESIIGKMTKCKILGRIPMVEELNRQFIEEEATKLLVSWER